MEGESIEVVSSEEDGGNGLPVEVTPPTETPSETPEAETPATPAEPVEEPTMPTPEVLYDLPDGRKVDAETLAREFKENFIPEFTRKSQELAQLKGGTEPNKPTEKEPWIPETYEEIVERAKQELRTDLEAEKQAQIERDTNLQNAVVEQLAAVKKIDPNINENALFQHALKYKFTDLGLAHQNMTDMNLIVKKVQKTTADNIAKRNDPVSITPGAIGQSVNPSNFETARDFLHSLK